MVYTKKFSDFANGNPNSTDNEVVGLSGGVNSTFQKVTTWTTLTRPSAPFNGLLGYNSTLDLYEFYSSVLADWVQLTTSESFDATYILQTPDVNLSNAQALSLLSTGILKSTTGTGVVSISAPLTSIDGLSTSSNQMIYTTASNTYATTTLTAYGRTFLASVDASAARSTLGLGTAALKAATDNAEPMLASVSGAFTIGHVVVAKDASGTLMDGGAPSTGSVTSVGTGTGLTGGPITTTGTISFADIADDRVLANISGGAAAPIPNTLTSIIDACIGGTQGDILYRGASSWAVLGAGTLGQFLQTQGAGSNPLWATSATVTPAAMTRVDDTNVTLTLGGAPATSLLQAVSLTLGWTGTLSSSRGGTGTGTFAINSMLYASSANTWGLITPANSSGLLTNGSGVPSWVAYTGTGAPMLNTSPRVVTSLLDVNGVTWLGQVATASAANYLTIANAASPGGPILQPNGSDSNIGLIINAKGSGIVQIQGCTDGSNAPAGYNGQFISSEILASSAVSLTSGNTANVTSISLTAGDWDIWAVISTRPNGSGAVTTNFNAAINTTSATLPSLTIITPYAALTNNSATANGTCNLTVGPGRVNITTTTTYYLVVNCSFTSTLGAFGYLCARRIR